MGGFTCEKEFRFYKLDFIVGTKYGCRRLREDKVRLLRQHQQHLPATTEAPKANEPTAEIQLMFPGTPQKDVALVEAEANKYLKDKLNVTLKINAVDWGQWDNKLNLMIASGEPSDIVFTAAWQRYAINVAKGAFLDLGPLIDKDAPELKKELDPAFFEGSKINGKNYGIPTNKELAATRGVVYRQDLAEKYQLDVSKVKTWADLEPLLKVIKEKEPTLLLSL